MKFTWGQGDGDDATDATQRHRQTQRPPATPPVHEQPTYQAARHFHDGRQQKTQVLILSQRWTVITQSNIHHVVGEPETK